MTESPRIVFLGPQRREPTVLETLRDLPGVDPAAPVAVVTAGWEERELETEEFEQHIGGRAINLEVYHGIEAIYTRDPSLREATRERHDRLRALQRLYRVRLSHGIGAARELFEADADGELLQPELEAAIAAIREIDRHHFERVAAIHEEFRARLRPADHPLIAAYREQMQRHLSECSTLCIAGGHVAILLNRLRLAGVLRHWGDRPIVAWGAGAMALTERVVVFHDSPPQGAGNAEVLEAGLGVAPGMVALPHATQRLRLDDSTRVGLFARRFGPARCVALDVGARIAFDGSGWSAVRPTRQLEPAGEVAEIST